eukprot:g6964.t1
MTDVAVTSGWNSSFFAPCMGKSPKGCGMIPCCLPNCVCCMPCMWANALTQIKGKSYSWWKCCIAVQLCPCCTFCAVYKDLTEHYKVEDKMCCVKASCTPVLSYFQILDHVLVKENLHMTMNGGVVPDAAPAAAEMVRSEE